MNSIAKTSALWVALLLTAVLLYNGFKTPLTGKETELNFSKFLEEVDNKNVKNVKIADADLTGEFVQGGSFKTTVPENYAALYDKLAGVDVKIENPTQSPWLAALISWAPFLFIIGFWIVIMQQKLGPLQKRKSRNEQYPDETGLIQLDPDVAKAFSNAQAVNNALRLVIQLTEIRGTT